MKDNTFLYGYNQRKELIEWGKDVISQGNIGKVDKMNKAIGDMIHKAYTHYLR